jgi:hypothetical protein
LLLVVVVVVLGLLGQSLGSPPQHLIGVAPKGRVFLKNNWNNFLDLLLL